MLSRASRLKETQLLIEPWLVDSKKNKRVNEGEKRGGGRKQGKGLKNQKRKREIRAVETQGGLKHEWDDFICVFSQRKNGVWRPDLIPGTDGECPGLALGMHLKILARGCRYRLEMERARRGFGEHAI